VFVRRTSENREWLRERTIPKARVGEHLVSSCRTYVEHSPELPNCARTLGMLLLQMGERAQARNAFELYRRNYPYADPEVDRLLAELPRS
jgi:regulator of sirC expression with transglutaminase-like and TPR domain